jgi:hypothetical protein
VVETPVVVTPATDASQAAPISYMTVADDEPVVIPVTEAAVFEDNVERTVLVDPIFPEYQHTVVIREAQTPVATPIAHTVVTEEEEVVAPKSKAYIYEDRKYSVIEDEKRRTTVIDETIIEAPVVHDIFDVADNTQTATEKPIIEDAYGDKNNYLELNYNEENNDKPVEQPVLIKRINTTVMEDDKIVLQVSEEHREALPVVEKVVLADEPKHTPKQVHISTIPMDPKGNIMREEPMIPMIPPMSAKGIGSNASETPFVLPATEDGRKTMADYKELAAMKAKAEEEPIAREDAAAPAAPVAPQVMPDNSNAPAQTSAPAPAPASNESNEPKVIVADSDNMNLDFGEFDMPDEEPTPEPEIIPEPNEEPTPEPEIIPEPEEEPVEEPIVEPVEEPTPEPAPEVEIPAEPEEEPAPEIIPEPDIPAEPEVEPIEEPIFTDAEHADELMTDEEAEEHIEMIEEAPGQTRKGKLHAINLDTLCENFEEGEQVTLEALQAKKLAPKNSGRVKILARGTMTKKLDIVADNFSLQAVKMITLAGGRAEQFK